MVEAAAGKVPPIVSGARIDRNELVLLVREDEAGSVWLARENAPAKAERARFSAPTKPSTPPNGAAETG